MNTQKFNNQQRSVVHIDADAFFASIEQRDNPSLKGKPVIIGHDPKSRGVVSTCSYEARAFGVHSAMPVSQAYRLCPDGIFVKPRMKRYQEASRAMFEIFDNYSPLVEELSIDEAFIDATGENSVPLAMDIRKEVKKQLGITVTAGISYCKYLAKIASDLAKPNGLKQVEKHQALSFLEALPVSRLPGIGPKTAAKLNSIGISTIKTLRQMPQDWFSKVFGKSGNRIFDLSNGVDNEPVVGSRQVKSIGEETTFSKDIAEKKALKPILASLSQNVAFRLRKARLACKTVAVKIRFANFSTITREHTLPQYILSDRDIFNEANKLLNGAFLQRPVRLLGVTVKNFVQEDQIPSSLFQDHDKSWDTISKSMDVLRTRYGKPVLFLGSSIQPQKSESEE